MAASISVIIPVYNASGHLRRCLTSLQRSDTREFECIVVDDGSTDDSPAVAREFGARVLFAGERGGPARARNLGAQEAHSEVILFLDADVCVHTDTIGRIRAAFEEDPELCAIMGSYDESPGCDEFLSQYRNLMHAFVHRNGRRAAQTFWSGCGAIRRDLFLSHGGFSHSYGRPAIEDIELGYRLQTDGRKLMLDSEIQVQHLKRWTLWGMVRTDVFDRGIPWTELILRDRCMPNDLNLQSSQRLSVVLAYLTVAVATVCSFTFGRYFLVPVISLLFFILSRYWLEAGWERKSLVGVASIGGVVIALAGLAYTHFMEELVPMLILCPVLAFSRPYYKGLDTRLRRWSRGVFAVFLAIAFLFVIDRLPEDWMVLAFFLLLAGIVILNLRFYLFLMRKKGIFFAVAAMPFHALFYFYSGLAFGAGILSFCWSTIRLKKVSHAATP
ncbi:MAG: glycosyltransferase family 2 protein [Acidobacteria bacterium]|nr:glycosyltransferase family 2 protein [Acidobacteriota bacterium]